MGKTKIKVSYHSGKGYAKHNNHYPVKRDKGNINHSLTRQNKIWTCMDGVTDVVEAEKMLYDCMFSAELKLQNDKYRKKGNYGRVRNMDEWMKAERHRPTENILQIGNMDCHIQPIDLWDCYVEFAKWRNCRFGNNFFLISSVMHVDEATPHIHERYVWYWTDDNGVKHTGIKKSLEQAGVDLPDPSKPEDRDNYRKMTFDAICRKKWQDIVEKMLEKYKDLELDRTVDQYRKQHRIGHMGVASWRAYESALKRVRRTASMVQKREDDLKQREEEIKAEQKKLAAASDSLALAAQQQDADMVALAEKMAEIEAREQDLHEQECTIKQRITAAVKRRMEAEKKSEQVKGELKRYYDDPGYTLGSNS